MSMAGIGPTEQAYLKFRGTLAGIKNVIARRRPMLDVPMGTEHMEALFHDMRRRQLELVSLAATPGLRRLARIVQNDSTYDPAAEFAVTNGLIDSLKAIAKALIPLSADGSLQGRSWTGDDTYIYSDISVVDMEQLRNAVDALDADIDVVTVI